MGESEVIKDIPLITEDDGEPDDGLWQELSQQSHRDIVICHLQPFLTSGKLQLRTNGIGGDQEDKQHDKTRHHHRTQIGIIVTPWVGYHMEVDRDRL